MLPQRSNIRYSMMEYPLEMNREDETTLFKENIVSIHKQMSTGRSVIHSTLKRSNRAMEKCLCIHPKVRAKSAASLLAI